jgi:hypothetical protein
MKADPAKPYSFQKHAKPYFTGDIRLYGNLIDKHLKAR